MRDEGSTNIVTERDTAALVFVTRWGFAATHQIADAIYGGSSAVAYRRMRVLQRKRLVLRRATLHGHPSVYIATALGARTANCGLRPARIGYAILASLGHSLSLIDIAQEWMRRVPGVTYTTEREIRANWHRATATERRGFGRIPDLLIHTPTGQTFAVEMDWTAKRSSEYRKLLIDYRANPRYARVCWFCKSKVVAERLKTVVKELGFSSYVSVAAWGRGGVS